MRRARIHLFCEGPPLFFVGGASLWHVVHVENLAWNLVAEIKPATRLSAVQALGGGRGKFVGDRRVEFLGRSEWHVSRRSCRMARLVSLDFLETLVNAFTRTVSSKEIAKDELPSTFLTLLASDRHIGFIGSTTHVHTHRKQSYASSRAFSLGDPSSLVSSFTV